MGVPSNTITIAGSSPTIARQLARQSGGSHGAALRWSARLLVAASWISGAIFATYIIAFFGGVVLAGAGERWNESLPGLYDGGALLSTAAIGVHFMAGGVLLLLGPVQLIGSVRRNVPALHRWLGRSYVISAGLAGLGGLGFILRRGTVGGPIMDTGFGIYGALMVLCAAMAYARARAGNYDQHRAWAVRLFALTVGSWLYRMEYGAWFLLSGGVGIRPGFTGLFDAIMMFFFYVPNLIVAELFIRARRRDFGALASFGAATVLLAASAFIIFATWSFTARSWGPRMISGITEASL
ncbi:hypothetical protein AM571_PA00158 (plasmid) [Rhizobium etli 8C-3]|uniref:DUF2306 domain-containing protein n=1 Tax=Rhizobium etli 8C-3 TaxID=538025 RepID=A0A1L5PAB2_RHIET|nr:DUF2306 domain-containing protein [Rhizobium etli]APO77044.1 hypothetical protein AM571_PA00158 [Rhizobium etli 8C-3]